MRQDKNSQIRFIKEKIVSYENMIMNTDSVEQENYANMELDYYYSILETLEKRE